MSITVSINDNDNGSANGTVIDAAGDTWEWERSDGTNPATGGEFLDVWSWRYDGDGETKLAPAQDTLSSEDLLTLLEAIETAFNPEAT